MNRIVRKLMPASELPEALRNQFSDQDQVFVTVETLEDIKTVNRTPPAWSEEEFRQRIAKYKLENRHPVSEEEAVARIRQLRDEWDDP